MSSRPWQGTVVASASSTSLGMPTGLAALREVAIKTSLGRPGFSVAPALLHRAPPDEGFVELATSRRRMCCAPPGCQGCIGTRLIDC